MLLRVVRDMRKVLKFTCFTSTKVQILTRIDEALDAASRRARHAQGTSCFTSPLLVQKYKYWLRCVWIILRVVRDTRMALLNLLSLLVQKVQKTDVAALDAASRRARHAQGPEIYVLY
jgi:hypothetical protein